MVSFSDENTFKIIPDEDRLENDPVLKSILQTVREKSRLLLLLSALSFAIGFTWYSFAAREYLSEMTLSASDYALLSSVSSDLDLGEMNFSDQVAPLSLFLAMLRSQSLAEKLAQTPEFQQLLKDRKDWFSSDSDVVRVQKYLLRYVSTIQDFSRTIYTIRLIDTDAVRSQKLLTVFFREADEFLRQIYTRDLKTSIDFLEGEMAKVKDLQMRSNLKSQLDVFYQKKIALSTPLAFSTSVITYPNLPQSPITPRLLPSLIVPWLWTMFGFLAFRRLGGNKKK